MNNYYNFFNSLNNKEPKENFDDVESQHCCDDECEDCCDEHSEHCDCDHQDTGHCDCHHEHNQPKSYKNYKDFEFDDSQDMTCDLEPNKICDNCGRCLTEFNTDDEGYVQIKIDGIDRSGLPLDTLYQMYGLDDSDDNE